MSEATANSERRGTTDSQPGNTHKQLAGHDDGGSMSVHVDLDDVSVPRAVQKLIVWERR